MGRWYIMAKLQTATNCGTGDEGSDGSVEVSLGCGVVEQQDTTYDRDEHDEEWCPRRENLEWENGLESVLGLDEDEGGEEERGERSRDDDQGVRPLREVAVSMRQRE